MARNLHNSQNLIAAETPPRPSHEYGNVRRKPLRAEGIRTRLPEE